MYQFVPIDSVPYTYILKYLCNYLFKFLCSKSKIPFFYTCSYFFVPYYGLFNSAVFTDAAGKDMYTPRMVANTAYILTVECWCSPCMEAILKLMQLLCKLNHLENSCKSKLPTQPFLYTDKLIISKATVTNGTMQCSVKTVIIIAVSFIRQYCLQLKW